MRSIKRTSIALVALCAAFNAYAQPAPARYPAKVVRLIVGFAPGGAVDVQARQLIALGIEPVGSTPAEFTAHLNKEIARWTPIIQKAGIKPD